MSPRGRSSAGKNNPDELSVRMEWNATGGDQYTRQRSDLMNINRVVLSGNLTADPDERALPSGTSVTRLRLAVNTRRKNGSTGEWEEKANYFNVTVWGAQGANCARYLSKGRPVAIDGRLEWREYTTQDGQRREAVEVIGDTVQFLGGGREQNGNGPGDPRPAAAPAPIDTGDFDAAPAFGAGAATSDDIPF
jgi:single-strand DNA-binding protein